MIQYLLDSDHIIELLKGNQSVKERLADAVVWGDVFINGIAYYETKRGILAADATNELKAFETLCNTLGILLLDTKRVFDTASEIYAHLEKKGQRIRDGDVLIASTAVENDLVVVSNDQHYAQVPNLRTESWLTK